MTSTKQKTNIDKLTSKFKKDSLDFINLMQNPLWQESIDFFVDKYKQKVKEAIEKTFADRKQTTDKIIWQTKFKEALLKELGLD